MPPLCDWFIRYVMHRYVAASKQQE
jgi:hypothetical protein